ncbi:MAG: hypothetical protein A3F67_03480 [Verrucomicrobia bacterium RIFCSPHIGHO2_12_FULL_41_10]|nr:MAG: hypothetical protein A3F67_03480 [Verrucomicrobia bacterium RIFCSPHIGHO2_12_FULL_41_10]
MKEKEHKKENYLTAENAENRLRNKRCLKINPRDLSYNSTKFFNVFHSLRSLRLIKFVTIRPVGRIVMF